MPHVIADVPGVAPVFSHNVIFFTEQHDTPEGKYGRRVKVEFKRGLALRGALPRGWAKVIVQTAAVTQIKEFDVEAADEVAECPAAVEYLELADQPYVGGVYVKLYLRGALETRRECLSEIVV